MFRCCLNIIKINRNNAGQYQKYAISVRKYSDLPYNRPFKRPTMDELPIPSGSWAAKYAKSNKQKNAILLIGVGVFGVSLTYLLKQDYLSPAAGPKIGETKSSSDAKEAGSIEDASHSEKQVSKASEKETPSIKSEQDYIRVEVEVPALGKEPLKHETTSDSSALSDESSKDVVIITNFPSEDIDSPTESLVFEDDAESEKI